MRKPLATLFYALTCYLTLNASGNDLPILGGIFAASSIQTVDFTIAPNGTIFSVRTAVDSTNNSGNYRGSYSLNNGNSWISLDGHSGADFRFTDADVLITPLDSNHIYYFTARILHRVTPNDYSLVVERFTLEIMPDGQLQNQGFPTPMINYQLNPHKIYDVEFASDYKFPAVGASPYSVALVYTSEGVGGVDSLNYLVSVNGGSSFQNAKNVALAPNLRKASIAYGRSASSYNGRYYFAWEQFDSPTATKGHIYTARNASTVSGSLTPPQNLDSVNSSMINLCRNPRIAVSHDTTDNDAASMTAVILVDRDYNGDGSDYDVLGFYSKTPNMGNWSRLDIANGPEMAMQPDIVFDSQTNSFLTTYLDSTNGKLPYLLKDFNLASPNSWTNITPQYNDFSNGLRNAFPKLAVNETNSQPAFVWVQQNDTGKGIALFDAEYRQAVTTTLNVNTCANEPFSFNGEMLNSTGVYRDTFAIAGGDSLIILNLTVNSLVQRILTQDICNGASIVFNGQSLSTPGVYFDTISASIGCDTAVTLSLTVNIVVTPTIDQAGAALNTQAYTTYQWKLNGGDIPLANAQSYTATVNGIYTVEVTDATGCSATSASVTVTGVGISTVQEAGINVYPNPVTDILNVELTGNESAKLRIVDVTGSVVMEKTISEKASLNIQHLPKGIYMLQLTQAGRTAATKITRQ